MTQRLLASVSLRPLVPGVDMPAAARLYRRCRQVGITPRGLLDCVIAVVAARCGDRLLTLDGDLRRVAPVAGVALDEG